MNLWKFIHYFRKCPWCRAWMTLDADIPSPSELEIQKENLILSVYEDSSASPKVFRLNLKTNQVVSDHPFIFRGIHNDLRRIFSGQLSDYLKIESRCYNCMNFRYWSNNMLLDPKTNKLKHIGISGERLKIIKSFPEILLSSMYQSRTSEVNINGSIYSIPFLPFSSLNFKKPDSIIRKMKSILMLA